jgi:DNA-binding response OmpR family regulator
MNARILLADDEPGTLRTLNLLLQSEGYTVMPCIDGMGALSHIEEAQQAGTPFDLLVTDIHMPMMDGISLLQELRKENLTTRCLGISGQSSKEMLRELMRLGCLDFLDKPFDERHFLEAVRSVLKRPLPGGDKETESRLRAELVRYRRDMKGLRQRIRAAQGEFRSLMAPEIENQPIAMRLFSRPLNVLGGDLFLTMRHGHNLDILVGDVAGHDQGASFMALLVKSFFEQGCQRSANGQDVLRIINDGIRQQNSERLVTALHVRLDLITFHMELHNAGHVPMIRVPSDAALEVEALAYPSLVLGLFQEPDLAHDMFKTASGDRFIACSDGFYGLLRVDGATGQEEEYGIGHLLEAARKHRQAPFGEFGEALWQEALTFSRHKAQDDLLLGIFEIP